MSNLEDLLQARLAELKEQTSRAAEILVKHHSAHVDLAPDQMFRFTCTCEHSELVGGPTRRAGSKTDWLSAHQANQLAPLILEAQAKALREAADAYDYNAWSSTYTSMQDDPDANLDAVGVSIEWLRARADKLETL